MRVAVGLDAEVDQRVDADLHLALVAIEQDLHDALRGAAQSERILRAGRLRADGEEADQRVDAVGERDHGAGDVARQRVVETDRLVVIVDRLPDVLRQPFLARVDAADAGPGGR